MQHSAQGGVRFRTNLPGSIRIYFPVFPGAALTDTSTTGWELNDRFRLVCLVLIWSCPGRCVEGPGGDGRLTWQRLMEGHTARALPRSRGRA
jgi:hypothetical protein